jgi:hypothetical protein
VEDRLLSIQLLRCEELVSTCFKNKLSILRQPVTNLLLDDESSSVLSSTKSGKMLRIAPVDAILVAEKDVVASSEITIPVLYMTFDLWAFSPN